MKNISFLIFVLLLTALLHEAQGMKSRKLLTNTSGSTSTSTSTTTSSSLKNHKKIEGDASEVKDNCKMSNSAPTKQGEDSRKQENFSVKSSPVVEQRQDAPKHNPDVSDLAGMDYSPARRKSPIHN